MLLVVQRGQRAGLGDGVDVEWLADFFQRGNQLRVSDAVTQPQSSQAEDFRERPQQQQVRLRFDANEGQQIHRLFQKVDVSFVQHQQQVVGDFFHQVKDLFGRRQRAGRVIGVGREHDSGVGGESLEHRRQIVTVVSGRDADQAGPEQVSDEVINREGVLRDDHLRARSHQGVADKLDNFIGAVAEDEVRCLDAQLLSELLLQVKRVAVRIQVQIPQNFRHRCERGGRGAEWIFIGSQFDDALGGQSQFAGDFFDGPARSIDRQILERRVERERQTHANTSTVTQP